MGFVTKARQYSDITGPIRTAIIAGDGSLYIINDKNARKHSKYFEAQLQKRLGVELGDLLRIVGNGDGWDIIDTESNTSNISER